MNNLKNIDIKLSFFSSVIIYIYIIILISLLTWSPLIGAKECRNVDIRNNVTQFKDLRNCSVVFGYLQIVLMDKTHSSDFDDWTFPELREVTGFLFFFRVFGLTNIGALFPNLITVRGQNLIANYAIVIYDMPNLTELGLKSLLKIQRGYVRIEKCPSLCYANTIDWRNITGMGPNYIQKDPDICPDTQSCRLCSPPNCWSSRNCQRFDGQRNYGLNSRCHHDCLGGCVNETTSGCFACRGPSDRGTCVKGCEPPKLYNPAWFRCVTPDSCKQQKRINHDGRCLIECPVGFMNINMTCHRCKQSCPKTCGSAQIEYISDAEKLRGCTIINGTLQIKMNTDSVNFKEELEESLGAIEEIYGHLKIYRASSISSLSFFQSLAVIRGDVLDNDKFALVIYENSNLQTLIDFKNRESLRILKGGMLFHYNHKLCLSEIAKLQQNTIYDNSSDYISSESNGYKHACDLKTLSSDYKILSFDNATIYWQEYKPLRHQTILGYLIYYIEAPKENISPHYGRDTCSRFSWKSELISTEKLTIDPEKNMYAFNITKLKQITRYAFYVKTYLSSEGINGQTKIKYFKTPIDKLTPPFVSTLSKTSTSITLTWTVKPAEVPLIDHFYVDVFIRSDQKELLDSRNFCLYPRGSEIEFEPERKHCCSDHDDETAKIIHLHNNFGYSVSCDEDRFQPGCDLFEYDRFKRNLDELTSYCRHVDGVQNSACSFSLDTRVNQIMRKRDVSSYENYLTFYNISREVDNFTVQNLSPFTLYTFQFFACQDEDECSPYFLHDERTLPLEMADDVVMNITETDDEKGNIEFRVDEPIHPNGLTVAYHFEQRNMDINEKKGEIICITRRDHERNHFTYAVYGLKPATYAFRSRSISLAIDGRWTEWQFFKIDETKAVPYWQIILTVIFLLICILLAGYGIHRRYKYTFSWLRGRNRDDDCVFLMSALEAQLAENELQERFDEEQKIALRKEKQLTWPVVERRQIEAEIERKFINEGFGSDQDNLTEDDKLFDSRNDESDEFEDGAKSLVTF